MSVNFDPLRPGWWLQGNVERYARENPGYAVSVVSESGEAICGSVPHDWNGATVVLIADNKVFDPRY
jgi:hypothetical protein